MDDDASNVLRLAQAHVRPRPAAIFRFVNSIAPRRAALIVVLTGTDPKDLGIAGCDGDITDGGSALFIEDRLPRSTAVGGFPYATRCGGDVEKLTQSLADLRSWPFGHREIDHTSARDRWSNGSPWQLRESSGIRVKRCGSCFGVGRRLRVKRCGCRRKECDRECWSGSRASFCHDESEGRLNRIISFTTHRIAKRLRARRR